MVHIKILDRVFKITMIQGWWYGSSSKSACPTSVKSCIQTPVPPNNFLKNNYDSSVKRLSTEYGQ
jgi:hypothetical protein